MDAFNQMKKTFLQVTPKEKIKTDKNGRITNWNELSPQTKDWIKNG